MRPRGQTPRMLSEGNVLSSYPVPRFNEAAGADPADAWAGTLDGAQAAQRFNEAAGADPADA